MPDKALVVLRTPWRHGNQPSTQDTFKAHAFATAVMRRVALLAAAFADGDGIPLKAPDPRVEALQVWPVVQHRWAAKRRREDDMSGTVGSFVMHVSQDQPFWNALWLSQWTHIGAKTSFGLGSVRVHPLK